MTKSTRVDAVLGACAAALLLGCSAAAAQTQLRDEDTGLEISLPSGYAVVRSAPRPRQDVVFSIRGEPGTTPVAKNRDGSLCGLAFMRAPANAGLTQAEINALSHKPEWRNVAKATLELVFDVRQVDGIALNGVEGIAMHAVPKAAHPDQDVFMHMSMMETPKGRTTLVCATNQASAASAVPAFEALRAGVRLPR